MRLQQKGLLRKNQALVMILAYASTLKVEEVDAPASCSLAVAVPGVQIHDITHLLISGIRTSLQRNGNRLKWFNSSVDSGNRHYETYSLDYLVVGSGAGGAYDQQGGGAGGEVVSGTDTITAGTTYPIVVGAPGSAGTNGVAPGNGNSSSFNSHTATGGGKGGYNGVGGNAVNAGGGGRPSYAGGTGTRNGGTGGATSGGGGAGAGAAGGNGSGTTGGNGGDGVQSSITGTAEYYAGGGQGGGSTGSPTHGQGSGANKGGGGKGGGSNTNGDAGDAGGVTLRMLTANYSGITTGSPTVTTDGAYTVLKFTASGSYTG